MRSKLAVALLTTLAGSLLASSASAAEPQVPAPPAAPLSARSCAIVHAVADDALMTLGVDGRFCLEPTVFFGTP